MLYIMANGAIMVRILDFAQTLQDILVVHIPTCLTIQTHL